MTMSKYIRVGLHLGLGNVSGPGLKLDILLVSKGDHEAIAARAYIA